MSLSRGLLGEGGEAKRLQVDAASIADLKAELFRKKGEAIKNRQKGNYRPEKLADNKKTNIWSKENTGLLARMQKDLEEQAENEKTNDRVKAILARKAKIYESLKKSKGKSELSGNFLVEFSDKRDSSSDSEEDYASNEYPAKNSGEEWVEYTDSLGRTRMCMKKELGQMKKKEEEFRREDEDSDKETGRRETDDDLDLLSEDMRRELLRQKWEKEEMDNLTKDSLHYTDLRFDEARTHGAGFYAFSKDEAKRSEEQTTLRKLHEETDDMRRNREKKAEKRKKDMDDRIKRIREKRRKKLGLPPEETDEKKEGGTEDKEEDEDEENDEIAKSVMEGLKMFRRDTEKEERLRNERKRMENVRDWDLGKEDLENWKVERKVLTQQEWVTKQRQERTQEFAPPSAYSEARYLLKSQEEKLAAMAQHKTLSSTLHNSKASKVKEAKQKLSNLLGSASLSSAGSSPALQGWNAAAGSSLAHQGWNAAAAQAYQQPHAPPNWSASAQVATEITAPVASVGPTEKKFDPMSMLDSNEDADQQDVVANDPMASLDSSAPSRPEYNSLQRPEYNSLQRPEYNRFQRPEYSSQQRLELHRKMQEQEFLPAPSTSGLNSRIINELESRALETSEEEESEDETEAANLKRGRGAEVAPPCDMSYYSSAGQNKADRYKGYRSKDDMADAFSAGLNALKK